jgi:hypothetical protein
MIKHEAQLIFDVSALDVGSCAFDVTYWSSPLADSAESEGASSASDMVSERARCASTVRDPPSGATAKDTAEPSGGER